MHRMTNSLFEKQKQLDALLAASVSSDQKYAAVKKDGEAPEEEESLG